MTDTGKSIRTRLLNLAKKENFRFTVSNLGTYFTR
jgi:hypothetical protein